MWPQGFTSNLCTCQKPRTLLLWLVLDLRTLFSLGTSRPPRSITTRFFFFFLGALCTAISYISANTPSGFNFYVWFLQGARLIGTGTFGCGSTIVEGKEFIAENITFENSTPQVIFNFLSMFSISKFSNLLAFLVSC